MRLSGLAILPLAACVPEGIPTDLTREAARAAVQPAVAKQFPGVPLEPATNCIIDNATGSELLQLAKAGALGVQPETSGVVTEIATRPETLRCLAKDGLPALLTSL